MKHSSRAYARIKGLAGTLCLLTFLALVAAVSVRPEILPFFIPPLTYAADAAKTIVDLQPFRQSQSIPIRDETGREGTATLVNLNPAVNAWYLLRLDWQKGRGREDYHLENAHPRSQKILLDAGHPYGIVLAGPKDRFACDLWQSSGTGSLTQSRASRTTYAPLCGSRVYLRNPARGYRTEIETASEFLRNELPGGEKIETFIRDQFFVGRYREKAETGSASATSGNAPQTGEANMPKTAWLDPAERGRTVVSSHLGIDIEGASVRNIILGDWYRARENPGMSVSLITPNAVAPDILKSYRNLVRGLEAAEADSLVYLIAFDLSQFEVKYAMGTDHPKVGWSAHILDQMRNRSLPGPDGIGSVAPLVMTGLIGPQEADRTAAAFAGGFKRAHGAFKWGELARRNFGSHYGFMEDGVIFSRLQPGLATIFTLTDGRLEMKTWTETDNATLPQVRYARQNGVPIISGYDDATHMSVPGPLVSKWGEGNWSGSENRNLRTLRAAAALQEHDGKRFLLYAVFTSATPSAMVRVLQAYGCRYAMPLDMNALELTYLAVYRRRGSNLYVQHLIQGMSQTDKTVKGRLVPRFLAYPDNRDFFYLIRKGTP